MITIKVIHSWEDSPHEREIFEKLNFIIKQNEKIMSNLTDIQADVTALGTALTSLATAVSGLSTGIDPNGISAADALTLKESLDAEVAQAQGILAGLSTPPPPITPAP